MCDFAKNYTTGLVSCSHKKKVCEYFMLHSALIDFFVIGMFIYKAYSCDADALHVATFNASRSIVQVNLFYYYCHSMIHKMHTRTEKLTRSLSETRTAPQQVPHSFSTTSGTAISAKWLRFAC